MSLRIFLLLSLCTLTTSCLGDIGGDELTAAFAEGLPAATQTDVTSIANMAYFEASYLDAHRGIECEEITATVLVRLAHGGYGSYREAITAPNQFQVYSAYRLCDGAGCGRLTDGLRFDDSSSYTLYGATHETSELRRQQYRECLQHVESTLASTPEGGYYFFAAAGDGTNNFRSWYSLPEGLNLLSGEPGTAPEDAEPSEPEGETPSDSDEPPEAGGAEPTECGARSWWQEDVRPGRHAAGSPCGDTCDGYHFALCETEAGQEGWQFCLASGWAPCQLR